MMVCRMRMEGHVTPKRRERSSIDGSERATMTHSRSTDAPLRPPPIRTAESNRFAHYSMKVRVPKILDDVYAENPDYPAAIRDADARFRDDIQGDARVPALTFPAPDASEWQPELGEQT